MRRLLVKIGFFSALILMVWALSSKKMPTPGISLPQIQDITSQNQNEEPSSYSNGKLKIEYPSNWLGVNSAEILAGLTPPDWAEKYNLKVLLLAQNFQGGKFTQLIVYRGEFAMPIEEIFNKNKEGNEEQGWEIKVLESEIQENDAIFELEYKKEPGAALHAKEKILLNGNEAYLVSITAQENDWPETKETIDKIIDSAIMIE